MTRFRAASDREIEKAFLATADLADYLADIGDDAAREADRLAPKWITYYPAWKFTSGSRIENGRLVGYVQIASPFWHWPEYGTVNQPMTPYLRPGALVAITKRGGRLKETPKP